MRSQILVYCQLMKLGFHYWRLAIFPVPKTHNLLRAASRGDSLHDSYAVCDAIQTVSSRGLAHNKVPHCDNYCKI